MDIPTTLYRYRSMNEHDFDALEKSYLYFSPPKSFNDPFEFVAHESINIPDPIKRKDEFSKFSKLRFTESYDQLMQLDEVGKLRPFLEQRKIEWLHGLALLREEYEKHVYVCCFSARNNNQLMWGHYASGLKGMVMGFNADDLAMDTGNSKNSSIRKVSYSCNSKIPIVDYVEMLSIPDDTAEYRTILDRNFTKKFCAKSWDWEYEKEFRILWFGEIGEQHNKVPFSPQALKEIIFGELMPDKKRARVREILKGKGIKFREAVRSKSHYAIIIHDLS